MDLYNIKTKTKAWRHKPLYYVYNNHRETKEKRKHCSLMTTGLGEPVFLITDYRLQDYMHHSFLQLQTYNKPSITCFLELNFLAQPQTCISRKRPLRHGYSNICSRLKFRDSLHMSSFISSSFKVACSKSKTNGDGQTGSSLIS